MVSDAAQTSRTGIRSRGAIDADAVLVSTNGARNLWAGIKGSDPARLRRASGLGDDAILGLLSHRSPAEVRAALA